MNESMDWPDNPFWDFSLDLYRRPGVAEACLALQERHGIDVNLILYFVWLGVERGVALSDDDVAATLAYVGGWHDTVVRPLRAVRSAMKHDTHGAPRDDANVLRVRIKACELDAERIEQGMLFQQKLNVVPGSSACASFARETLGSYLKNRAIVPDSRTMLDLETILNATES